MLLIEISHLPGSNLAYLKDAGVWQYCELGRTQAKKAAKVPKAMFIIHKETKCSFLSLRCTREKVLGAMFWRLNLNMFSFQFCSERNARSFYHLGINAANFPGKGSYGISCLVKTERRPI